MGKAWREEFQVAEGFKVAFGQIHALFTAFQKGSARLEKLQQTLLAELIAPQSAPEGVFRRGKKALIRLG